MKLTQWRVMVSKRQERKDREFVREIALMFAEARGNTHHLYCDSEDCWWGVHCKSAEEATAAYQEHLRTSARHNDQPWIDRYNRHRRGLRPIGEEED
jgi:hypothetical protein